MTDGLSFFQQVIAKSQATLDQVIVPERQTGAHEAIKRDRFDEWEWAALRQDVPSLDSNIDELAEKHDYVEDFFEDFFNTLHQGDPMLHDKEVMDERFHANHDLAEHFKDLPEVKSLRVSTMHDQYATAMAMLSMQSTLKEAYEKADEAREQQQQAEEQRQKLQEMLQQLADMMQQAEQMDEESDDFDEEAAQALAESMDELAEQIAEQANVTVQVQQQAAQASQEAAASSELQIRAAARKADQEIQEENELIKSFGVEDGELQRMSYAERKALTEKLRKNRMAQFADVIGQLKNVQSAELRRRVVHAPDEVVGVELGDDLTRLSGGEMLNLAEPELEDDFWRRFADRELVVYQLRGKERIGKGPIITVVDESYSMMDRYGSAELPNATAEAWSKALALALCERARRDKRDFHYIGFSSEGQVWHLEFPRGQAPIAKVIEFTEHFFGGGTHYERPLRQAMEIVLNYEEHGKAKPDIVFITDDEYGTMQDGFMTDWNRAKKQTDMRCFGILIGRQGGASGAVNQVADNVRSLTELNGEAVRDIFRTV